VRSSQSCLLDLLKYEKFFIGKAGEVVKIRNIVRDVEGMIIIKFSGVKAIKRHCNIFA
jgi:hypothetical protein